MKKILFPILLVFAIVISGFSQVPDAFNYQSVVRNASGELVGNQDVSFKISILQDSESGTPVYVETHFITTNDFGIANLKIGQGTVESGIFAPGGWGLNTHFLKLEIDAEGGSSYSHMGTSQLLSVPYAFHAQTVAEDQVDDADADATNELQTISLSGTDLTLSEGGGTVTLADNQSLSIAGNDLSISDGNTVSIPDMADDWGTQAVESNFSLTGDGTAANPLAVIGNLTDDQTLSVSGNDLTISGGNTVAIPSSPWTETSTGIYNEDKQVTIGGLPSTGLQQFRVYAESGKIGVYARNNSGLYASIYADNIGGGPAAQFADHLRISDGTQGTGKVLTSDASGNTSWQTPTIIAYARVFSNGYTSANSGNITVNKGGDGQYVIQIDGESYSSAYVTTATNDGIIGFIRTSGAFGSLIVNTYDKLGVSADADFSFIVIKP